MTFWKIPPIHHIPKGPNPPSPPQPSRRLHTPIALSSSSPLSSQTLALGPSWREEDCRCGVMEGSSHGGGGGAAAASLPPFLSKTYEMVDDPATDAVVTWTPGGASFVVANQAEFSRDLLPKYFKHSNFSSFVRQLNTYGFRKVDPEQWEFANEDFIRGQRHRLKNIHRRKPIFSHSSHNQGTGTLAETERREYEEEIEKLKCENAALILELQKNAHKKLDMDRRMQLLEDKLVVMEDRQKSLLGYLRQIVRAPGFLSSFVEQSDHHSKKRRLPKTVLFHDDANVEDSPIVRYQDLTSTPARALNAESFDRMESSLNSLENFLRGVSEPFGDDMSYDNTMPCPPSAVVLTELHTSSAESDPSLPLQPSKMHTSSAGVGDSHSSPDLAESTSCAESPTTIPPTHTRIDSRSKVSEIDVNSEPAVTEAGLSRDKPAEKAAPVVPTGVNDGFWQQFLTEQPGSSDAQQEVQSERRDGDDKLDQVETGDRENLWWGKKNVEHITEKMGHLTSAERT